jgi:hypothetical protein
MTRIASTIVVCLMLAVPCAVSAAGTQDYRSPDARPATVSQDLRSPDARPVGVSQDLRSPDAKPIALRHFEPPVPSKTSPASGFEWGYLAAGIALVLAGVGVLAYTTHRRRTLTAA